MKDGFRQGSHANCALYRTRGNQVSVSCRLLSSKQSVICCRCLPSTKKQPYVIPSHLLRPSIFFSLFYFAFFFLLFRIFSLVFFCYFPPVFFLFFCLFTSFPEKMARNLFLKFPGRGPFRFSVASGFICGLDHIHLRNFTLPTKVCFSLLHKLVL